VRFGKIGTEGQAPKTKDAGTPEKAIAAIEKLIREKKGKGYAEVTSTATKAEKKIAVVNPPSTIEEFPANAKKPLTKKYVQSIAATLRKRKKHTSSADFSQFDAITLGAAEELAPYCFDLDLSGVKEISAPVIYALNKFELEGNESGWHTCEMNLSGLTTIIAELATAFVERFQNLPKWAMPGGIVLSQKTLDALTPAVAKTLTKCKAKIEVSEKSTNPHLSTQVAEILCKTAEKSGNLDLIWVQTATDEAFEYISQYGGNVNLNSLRSLSPRATESLSKQRGSLSLCRLESISDNAIVLLSRIHGDLAIRLESLSETAAEALGNVTGELYIFGISSLSGATAASLAKCKGPLCIPDLTDVSEEVAEGLAKHKGRLTLQGVKRMSDKAIESLCRHEGFLDLWRLDNISDTAIQSLCKRDKDQLFLNPFYESKVAEARKALALQNRRAKPGDRVIYPRLAEARVAGATFVRCVFEGFGDDGCFMHQVFKNGKEIDFNVDVETDVESIVEQNGFIVDGMMNGSVGILEIDLKSGEAVFWDAQQAAETQRFAEFLLRCEWEKAVTLAANIKMLVDEDDCPEQELSSVTIDPASAKKVLQPELKKLLYRIDHLEGGEELMGQIRHQCGTSVTLKVDVAARTFVFAGNGKKVSAKVPKNELEVTRFKVDLGNSSDTNSKIVKKGKK
jgi:hypothetical protein